MIIAAAYGAKKVALRKHAGSLMEGFTAARTGLFPAGSPNEVPLERGIVLKLGGEELVQEKLEDAAFFSMFLEYARLVLFNEGHGQIARLEALAKSALPAGWKVEGSWAKAPRIVPIKVDF